MLGALLGMLDKLGGERRSSSSVRRACGCRRSGGDPVAVDTLTIDSGDDPTRVTSGARTKYMNGLGLICRAPVDVERVGVGSRSKRGQHDLEDVAGDDVLLGDGTAR